MHFTFSIIRKEVKRKEKVISVWIDSCQETPCEFVRYILTEPGVYVDPLLSYGSKAANFVHG